MYHTTVSAKVHKNAAAASINTWLWEIVSKSLFQVLDSRTLEFIRIWELDMQRILSTTSAKKNTFALGLMNLIF